MQRRCVRSLEILPRSWGIAALIVSSTVGLYAQAPSKEYVRLGDRVIAIETAPQSGYQYRRQITIDHTKVPNTDQPNFPVLISGAYSYLATVANGGQVQNANGYDIIFSADQGGTQKLGHESETYRASDGNVNIWVRVPALSHTTDTVLYMFYGNSAISTSQEDKAGVWDGNFQAVWHLGNGTTLSGADSTSHGWSGTVAGATATSGAIDGAGNFSAGSGQYINIGDMGVRPTRGTVSLWVRASALYNYLDAFTTGPLGDCAGGNAAVRFELHADAIFLSHIGADFSDCYLYFDYPYVSGFTANVWHHVVATWDSSASTHSLYYDGAITQPTQTMTNTYWPTRFNYVKIGVGFSTDRYWSGQIDEVRMSDTARSADWIVTEYNNQSSPSTFYSIGSEMRP